MKRLAAVAAALLLAACSGSGVRYEPADSTSFFALAPNKVRLSGTYPVASRNATIAGIVAGADKRLWFTEYSGDAVGAITTSGVARTWATGTGAQLWGIAARGKTVYTGGNGVLFKVTLRGKFVAQPVHGARVGDMIEGPDKNLWFADFGNKKIGRIAVNYVVTEFALPAGASPNSLAFGADGNLWIADSGRGKIVKMSAKGKVLASYGRGITKGEYLDFVVAAPDGNLYFSENDNGKKLADKIGRITTTGKISEIGSLPPGSAPSRLTVGNDGNVYFAFLALKAVGVVKTASGSVSYRHVNLANDAGTYSIAAGPDKRLWLGGNSTIYAVSY